MNEKKQTSKIENLTKSELTIHLSDSIVKTLPKKGLDKITKKQIEEIICGPALPGHI